MRSRLNLLEKGYQGDFSVGRTEVGGDAVFYLDASVDGTGGNLRKKPVFTAQQAADYLNRGDGKIDGHETGAIWRGALDAINNPRHPAYGTALPNDYVSGALTHLNFGFYNTVDDIDAGYDYIPSSTVPGALRLDGFSAFSAAQRDAARQAIDAWDELINITFVETDAAHADINFMNTTTGPIQASAYLPWYYGIGPETDENGNLIDWNRLAGDVAVNPAQASNQVFDEGQYGLTTLVHELGHSLGLEHPGAYNFGLNFSATYENGAEYYQDSNQYSIMSYWDAEETGAAHVDWKYLTYRYSSTPSVHDILSIQQMYGADMSTRNGNDTYGFNVSLSTTGFDDDSYDFIDTPFPVLTIWDGGGTDTLDLSGFNTDSIIDLNPGAFSSAGGYLSNTIPSLAEINANRAAIGLAPRSQATYDVYLDLFKASYTNGLLRDNISIAYGATIENATGGGGNDTITGNSVANVLLGLGGNDKIKGGAGDDTINGGLGIDDLTGGNGRDKFVFDNLTRDKIRDFDSGMDTIDLSAFDITASAVKLTKDSVFADTNGDGAYDLHIVINGEQVQMSDVFFG